MRNMNRIPMQVYFDPETAAFYKDYAKSVGKSFAEVIREVTNEKKKEIKFERKKIRKTVHPLFKVLEEVRKNLKGTKYYYKDLSDDELLYGR